MKFTPPRLLAEGVPIRTVMGILRQVEWTIKTRDMDYCSGWRRSFFLDSSCIGSLAGFDGQWESFFALRFLQIVGTFAPFEEFVY